MCYAKHCTIVTKTILVKRSNDRNVMKCNKQGQAVRQRLLRNIITLNMRGSEYFTGASHSAWVLVASDYSVVGHVIYHDHVTIHVSCVIFQGLFVSLFRYIYMRALLEN